MDGKVMDRQVIDRQIEDRQIEDRQTGRNKADERWYPSRPCSESSFFIAPERIMTRIKCGVVR
jgi:hypothetical protein